jgi:hypothetical protein
VDAAGGDTFVGMSCMRVSDRVARQVALVEDILQLYPV